MDYFCDKIFFALGVGIAVGRVLFIQRDFQPFIFGGSFWIVVQKITEVKFIAVAAIFDADVKDVLRVAAFGVALVEGESPLAFAHQNVARGGQRVLHKNAGSDVAKINLNQNVDDWLCLYAADCRASDVAYSFCPPATPRKLKEKDATVLQSAFRLGSLQYLPGSQTYCAVQFSIFRSARRPRCSSLFVTSTALFTSALAPMKMSASSMSVPLRRSSA